MIFFFKMTAPHSNMKPKQQIKQIEPSFKPSLYATKDCLFHHGIHDFEATTADDLAHLVHGGPNVDHSSDAGVQLVSWTQLRPASRITNRYWYYNLLHLHFQELHG